MNINEKRVHLAANKSEAYPSSVAWPPDYTVDNNVVPAYINGNGMAGRFKKLFTIVTKKLKNSLMLEMHKRAVLLVLILMAVSKADAYGRSEALVTMANN
ncbi:hypothetical protein FEM48_ZijujUnG0030400 [Ziziphus jujuba var. spinosa]|uniref:Uncharacterized protein n=1 Tax=Ziziphus jujuba var. spinosa TaxID=714518 RepID=A0A978U9K3_ZIZJJ|nr:hypothetical protein FEM48_ZijujUnG0030400 [Ziziphus jujuba var. spinosa]